MNHNLTHLERLPRIDMAAFDDVQFLYEPRLRLVQRAYHSLQRTKQRWAEIGVFGAAGDRMINPRLHMSQALANSTLPRATLHDYQAEQVQLGLRLAWALQQRAEEQGLKVGTRPMAEKPQWCDLGGVRLGTRLHIEDAGVWLFQRYDAHRDADRPLDHIIMLMPRQGGQAVPATCTMMPVTSELSHQRAMELAELGRWSLRQPAYCPAL